MRAVKYAFGDIDKSEAFVEYRGRGKWAVSDGLGNVLNRDLKWEWEPQPSSRDDAFLARCRFDDELEAINAYMGYVKHRDGAVTPPADDVRP